MNKAAAPKLVPIWAMVEGGAPVEGGRVQLFAGTGSKRHQLAVSDSIRTTSDRGTVVLHPQRIPHDLTVVVRHGTVDGKRFPGALKLRVRGYRSPDILTVNPVSTIIAGYRQAHPEASPRKATSRVKRYLKIPAFHDVAIDLRRSDSYFDGDVLLERLKRRQMADLVRKTVATMDRVGRHGSDPFVKRHRKATFKQSVARSSRALGDAEDSGAAFIAKNLLSGVLSAAGGQVENAALGFVLSSFGLGGGDSDAAALAQIETQLTQISAQLSDLEAGVSQIEAELSKDEYETLVAEADADQSLIDGAENCLSYILAMPPSSPDLKVLSTGLVSYIGQKLLPIGDDLRTRLTGSGGLVQASYAATLAEAKDETNPSFPFWTREDGDVPRSVLDFYAAYQAELAMFVAEYDHVQKLDVATVTANVNSFGQDIDAELTQLKSRVPDGTVVDTNTGLVWNQEPSLQCVSSYPGEVFLWSPLVNGEPISKTFPCGQTALPSTFEFFDGGPQTGRDPNGQEVQLDQYEPPFDLVDGVTVPGGVSPYELRAPKAEEIQALIQDWNGPGGASTPANFLVGHGGFELTQTLVWFDASGDGDPLCGEYFPGNDVCLALDLSVPSNHNAIEFLDPNTGQAGILWVADAPAGAFWF